MKCEYCGKAGNFDMINHLEKHPDCNKKHKEYLMKMFAWSYKKRLELYSGCGDG